jgi:hypothetical protein
MTLSKSTHRSWNKYYTFCSRIANFHTIPVSKAVSGKACALEAPDLMNIPLEKTLIVAASLLVASLSTNAIPTDITISGGADVVAAPSSDFANFGDTTVYNWLTGDVTAYNILHSTSLPAPVANLDNSPLSKIDTTASGPSSVTLTLNDSYDYIFLHWGGKNGGWGQAYYIGGSTGSFEFDAPPGGNPDVGGLSFYSLYGPTPTTDRVPDGGNTLTLLAFVCIGVFAARYFTRTPSLQKS